jgi:actin-related protein
LSNFQCMWITRAEYKETGESIVQKKCLWEILFFLSCI